MTMPQVRMCDVTECYYNQGQVCKALAINVGGSHPQCDTFTPSRQHGGPASIGQVGACKVTQCLYNSDMSCTAPGIDVSHHEQHADCSTYTTR
ncbi:MAG: DUF1540 domain-containing protein [Armatimonadetes bacterium]|nr:DUF1540 domain-containing protein [Armatimonadota bacterium]